MYSCLYYLSDSDIPDVSATCFLKFCCSLLSVLGEIKIVKALHNRSWMSISEAFVSYVFNLSIRCNGCGQFVSSRLFGNN